MRKSNKLSQHQMTEITEKLMALADLILYAYNSGPQVIIRFDEHSVKVSLRNWLASDGKQFLPAVEKIHADLQTTLQANNVLDAFQTLLYSGAIPDENPEEEKPSTTTPLKRQDTGDLTTGIYQMEPGIIHLIRPGLPTRANQDIVAKVKCHINTFLINANEAVITCLNSTLDQLAPIHSAYDQFIKKNLRQLPYSQSQSSNGDEIQSLSSLENDDPSAAIQRSNSGRKTKLALFPLEDEERDTKKLVTDGQRYLIALSESRDINCGWHLSQRGFINAANSTLFTVIQKQDHEINRHWLKFYTHAYAEDPTKPIDNRITSATHHLSIWLQTYGLSAATKIEYPPEIKAALITISVTGFSTSLVEKLKNIRDGELKEEKSESTDNTNAFFPSRKHGRDSQEAYDFEHPYDDDDEGMSDTEYEYPSDKKDERDKKSAFKRWKPGS